jgi:serine protease Do
MARWSIAAAALMLGGAAGVFLAGPILHGQAPVPPNVPKELTSYRDVVKKVLPGVVMIESKAKAAARRPSSRRRGSPFGDDQQIPPELRRFFQDLPKPQPQQFGDEDDDSPNLGLGSGFVVDPKGVILTNYHVVEGADEVDVYFKDGKKLASHDIKTDPKTDLAIVRVDAKEPLTALELGDSGEMEIGDRVLAVGAPFGLSGSVTAGIVSAKGRSLHMNMYEDFIQTDAAINPGNSGGPLINLEGQVIGIDSAIKSRTGGFQGVGMAISSNLAKNIMQQLLKTGAVHRGYLGVQIKDVTDTALAKRLGVPGEGGVLVTQVFPDSPSEKAGLKEGDVITALAGKPVKESRELQNIVAGLPTGKPVDLAVIRDGKPKDLSVKIAEQPKEFGSTAEAPSAHEGRQDRDNISLDKYGLEVTDLTPEVADQLGYKESAAGALITDVERNSPAFEAGLRRGMLITKVEKQTVKSARDLRDRLKKDTHEEGVLLQVQSPQGGSTFVLLKPTTADKRSEK